MLNIVFAPTLSQFAAIESLKNGRNNSEFMNIEYFKHLDYIYDRLIKMGLIVIKPNGPFYIFLDSCTIYELRRIRFDIDKTSERVSE